MTRIVVVALAALAAHAGAVEAQQPSAPRWAAAIDSLMLREMARTRTPGAQIAIVERGRLVYTRGYGVASVETGRPVTERTLFQTGSLPKLFTGMLLAQLASNGTLDLQAPASRYMPEIAGRQVGASTAHELLTHSAGWAGGGVPFGRSDEAALDAVHRNVGDTMIVSGLRGIYSYSNPSLAMAGYVAERAAARPFETLLDSILLRPLGMVRTTHRPMVAMTHDFSVGHLLAPGGAASRVVRPMPGNSAEWGAGFLYTNTAETARLAIAMMDGGMLDGKRVLSADAIRAVTTGHVSRGGSRELRAGYGMNNDSVGTHRFWQKGGSVDGYRALLTMWPSEKLAIAVFVNQHSDLTYDVTAKAAQTVAGIAPIPVPGSVSTTARRQPTAAERAELAGVYRVSRVKFELVDAGGRLERQLRDRAIPVLMTGADRFTLTAPSGDVTEFHVVRDTTGKIHYLFNGQSAFLRLEKP